MTGSGPPGPEGKQDSLLEGSSRVPSKVMGDATLVPVDFLVRSTHLQSLVITLTFCDPNALYTFLFKPVRDFIFSLLGNTTFSCLSVLVCFLLLGQNTTLLSIVQILTWLMRSCVLSVPLAVW